MTDEPLHRNEALAPTRRRALMVLGAGPLLAAWSPLDFLRAPINGTELPPVRIAGIPGLRRRDGKPVPGIEPETFVRRVSLLHVFASWCPDCRAEHPVLMTLADDRRFPLIGAAYKDSADNARSYLTRFGNPYVAVGVDTDDLIMKPLRQRGVPWTYVVDQAGKVVAHIAGPLTPERIASTIKPALEEAFRKGEPA